MLYEQWEKEETSKAVVARPVVRILKCDSGDESEYPWIGYGVSTLVIPPSDCWTEWQGIGNENGFARMGSFANDEPVERSYRYGDGTVRTLGIAHPFDKVNVDHPNAGHPTAVRFKNGGKKEVRIRATVK